MGTEQGVHLHLVVRLDDAGIEGEVRADGDNVTRFSGWLALMACVEQLARRERGPDAIRATPP